MSRDAYNNIIKVGDKVVLLGVSGDTVDTVESIDEHGWIILEGYEGRPLRPGLMVVVESAE